MEYIQHVLLSEKVFVEVQLQVDTRGSYTKQTAELRSLAHPLPG